MLKRFEVKNFKNFKENFVFDLTDTKNYDFNKECVKNGIVSKGIIYGPNGCGKSNLTRAIFDIRNHLLDNKISEVYQKNYLNANSEPTFAEFLYKFDFNGLEIIYRYGKKDTVTIVYEHLSINGEIVLNLDRRESDLATIKLKGAESLNNDLSKNKEISLLKYVRNNAILIDKNEIQAINKLYGFISDWIMLDSTNHNWTSNDKRLMSELIIGAGLEDFQSFLEEMGIKEKIITIEVDGEKRLGIRYGKYETDFFQVASTGTKSLAEAYISFIILKIQLKRYNNLNKKLIPTLVLMDEFDAFFHFKAAKTIVEKLKEVNAQIIFTTHNTSIMSNDILRPDCYFVMESDEIKPTFRYTDKELRKAHNIEKMFRAGAFSDE